MTGPEVLAALSTGDITVVCATITSGWVKVRRAHGHTPDGSGLYDELHGVLGDLHDAHQIAWQRESGPETVARVRRSIHLDEIAEAERLLSSERVA